MPKITGMSMDMKRESVTLLELLIVIVIIGVIAAVAIPQYGGVVRRSRIAKAEHAMALITQAGKIDQIENNLGAGVYTAMTAVRRAEITLGTLVSGIDLSSVDADTEWTYISNAAGVITASKLGTCAGATFTYDMDDNTRTPLSACP